MSDNRNMDMLMAFGFGLVAGAITALLIAPASGEETRRRIGEFAHDATGRAREEVGKMKDFVQDQAERVGHAIEEGKQAYRREKLNA